MKQVMEKRSKIVMRVKTTLIMIRAQRDWCPLLISASLLPFCVQGLKSAVYLSHRQHPVLFLKWGLYWINLIVNFIDRLTPSATLAQNSTVAILKFGQTQQGSAAEQSWFWAWGASFEFIIQIRFVSALQIKCSRFCFSCFFSPLSGFPSLIKD